MFHGSKIANWVGILTRGILLPQAVTKLGVRRTVINHNSQIFYDRNIKKISRILAGLEQEFILEMFGKHQAVILKVEMMGIL